MRQPYVCFFGPDGSGKTTLSRYLMVHAARSLGTRKVRRAWFRGTHTLASLIARLLRRFRTLRGPCNPYYEICVPRALKAPWMLIEIASIIPVLLAKLYVPLIMGYFVIGERGIIDFLVWMSLTLRSPELVKGFVGRALIALARSVGISIYVRAAPEVLKYRRRGSPEEGALGFQLIVYDAIAKAYNFPKIDTSKRGVMDCLNEVLTVIGLESEG